MSVSCDIHGNLVFSCTGRALNSDQLMSMFDIALGNEEGCKEDTNLVIERDPKIKMWDIHIQDNHRVAVFVLVNGSEATLYGAIHRAHIPLSCYRTPTRVRISLQLLRLYNLRRLTAPTIVQPQTLDTLYIKPFHLPIFDSRKLVAWRANLLLFADNSLASVLQGSNERKLIAAYHWLNNVMPNISRRKDESSRSALSVVSRMLPKPMYTKLQECELFIRLVRTICATEQQIILELSWPEKKTSTPRPRSRPGAVKPRCTARATKKKPVRKGTRAKRPSATYYDPISMHKQALRTVFPCRKASATKVFLGTPPANGFLNLATLSLTKGWLGTPLERLFTPSKHHVEFVIPFELAIPLLPHRLAVLSAGNAHIRLCDVWSIAIDHKTLVPREDVDSLRKWALTAGITAPSSSCALALTHEPEPLVDTKFNLTVEQAIQFAPPCMEALFHAISATGIGHNQRLALIPYLIRVGVSRQNIEHYCRTHWGRAWATSKAGKEIATMKSNMVVSCKKLAEWDMCPMVDIEDIPQTKCYRYGRENKQMPQLSNEVIFSPLSFTKLLLPKST